MIILLFQKYGENIWGWGKIYECICLVDKV